MTELDEKTAGTEESPSHSKTMEQPVSSSSSSPPFADVKEKGPPDNDDTQALALVDTEAPPHNTSTTRNKWTPVQANYPIDHDDETYPFLDSVTTMRQIKGYVNDENLLPTTTYSFIVTTTIPNVTNWVNLFVFTLQFASYLAVTISVIDWSNPENPCKFPANVTSPVRASQLLSMMYSILVQDSITKSLYTFRNGYNAAELRRCFPECAKKNLKVRWVVGLTLILSMGCYAQFLTLIMIMQSEDVLSVLLNYAAVSFIATIDDRVFYLGKRGWMGQKVERHVRLVSLADNVDPKPVWYRRVAHTIAILFLFGGMMGIWISVVNSQTSGKYLAKTTRVEFGDLVHPSLGTFSGFYDHFLDRSGVFSEAHSIYYERRSQKAFFGYCPEIKAWTFSYNVTADEFNACNWNAKSSQTEKFDIVTTATSQWYGKGEDGRTLPLNNMVITEWSCEGDEIFCGPHGTCIDKQCVCDKGYFGETCNFLEPCTNLDVDSRLGSFQGVDRKWSSQFEILKFGNKTAVVYDHPVYVTASSVRGRGPVTMQEDPLLQQNDGDEQEFDIIFYTGRRWALAFSGSFFDPEFKSDLESYLDSFHAHFADYEVAFLSEPIEAITANPSPTGLSWFLADPAVGTGIQAASSQGSEAVLLCSECNSTINPCLYDGVCKPSGICECSEGSEGALCEVPPIGNGRCDPFFNTVTFDMDGGDCCMATCVSSEDNICGKDATGFLDTGFFFCHNDDPIPSDTIRGEPFSEAGGIIALSDNGYVLAAVIEDGQVGLFDKEGAKWKQRIVIETCSVQAMAMASGPFASNPIFAPPVVIVTSCIDSTIVKAYFCTKDGCTTETLRPPPLAEPGLFGISVGISSDGDVIAVSSIGDPNSGGKGGFVDILRAERGGGGSVDWERNDEMIIPEKFGDFVDIPSSMSPSTSSTTVTPSPTPKPQSMPPQGGGDATIFEAEDATLVNTSIENRNTPFSGEGYGDMDGPGASMEWDAYDLDGGIYEISISYASASTRPASFLVDGVKVAAFEFEETSDWSDWTLESNYLQLNGGNHTLMVLADESTGPNIDFLSLRILPPTDSPTSSSVPSNIPSSQPSALPTVMPTIEPNQIVLEMSLSGSGEALAVVVADIVDKLNIRVYLYRFTGSIWVQRGSPIAETVCSRAFSPKDMIRLSHDGNVLLYSGGNIVKVFEWNGITFEWDQRGNGVLPSPDSPQRCSIDKVALSTDGNIFAVNFNVTANQRYITTFGWNIQARSAPMWSRREQLLLQGSPGGPLALASGGTELAVGLPLLAADLSGAIQTYEYPRRECDAGYDGFRVTFTIKPEITKWSLAVVDSNGGIAVTGGGPYFFPNFPDASEASETHHELATVVEEVCIPIDRVCTNLTVYPTDFGGFNIVKNGIVIFSQEAVDEPVTYSDGCGEFFNITT